MPVLDHAIHPMTQFDESHRYGCHSTRAPVVKSPGYWVKVRQYKDDGQFDYVDQFVLNTMSTLCRYIQRPGDMRCLDCTNESDTKYFLSYGL